MTRNHRRVTRHSARGHGCVLRVRRAALSSRAPLPRWTRFMPIMPAFQGRQRKRNVGGGCIMTHWRPGLQRLMLVALLALTAAIWTQHRVVEQYRAMMLRMLRDQGYAQLRHGRPVGDCLEGVAFESDQTRWRCVGGQWVRTDRQWL